MRGCGRYCRAEVYLLINMNTEGLERCLSHIILWSIRAGLLESYTWCLCGIKAPEVRWTAMRTLEQVCGSLLGSAVYCVVVRLFIYWITFVNMLKNVKCIHYIHSNIDPSHFLHKLRFSFSFCCMSNNFAPLEGPDPHFENHWHRMIFLFPQNAVL